MMTAFRRPLAAFMIAVVCGLMPVAGSHADDAISAETLVLPAVLNVADLTLYEQIFRVQEAGDWKTADALIAKLSDQLLMGHVLAQRYLHPTKYRSKYKELKAWMDEYADHPQARRIYKLALRRRPGNWKYPEKPDLPTWVPAQSERMEPLPAKNLKKSAKRKANQYRRTVKRHLKYGRTLAAKRLLQSADVKSLLSEAQYDELAAYQGFRYFIDERDEWALEWAGKAADRSGRLVPDAHWAAGLASYRLGRTAEAARHFEQVALSDRSSSWFVSAGGFWAARSYMLSRQPEKVAAMLDIAAEHPRTFYGLLAMHVLGLDQTFRWTDPPAHQAAVNRLAESPRGRRALALIDLGEVFEAERELRYLAIAAGEADREMAVGVLAVANRARLPALAVRLDETVLPDTGFHGAAYPLPSWRPDEGFTVDPALIYALIRQESRFKPEAKSWAGARGVMQLMPRTASFVTKDRKYFASRTPYLFDPVLNISIGQRYIEMLRDDPKIKGDLVAMLAAWNGGPGNLNKWRRNTTYHDDPLLFIEAIPSRETRNFVERVLANLWIYRHRMGEPAPSLDALAAGQWPTYIAVSNEVQQLAEEAAEQ